MLVFLHGAIVLVFCRSLNRGMCFEGKETSKRTVYARHPVEARKGNNIRTGNFNRVTTTVDYLNRDTTRVGCFNRLLQLQ